MSAIASIFRSPSTPKPPGPSAEEVRRRESEERLRAAAAAGRGSTILTGQDTRTGGLSPIGGKTLLGE